MGPTSVRTLEGQKVNLTCDVIDRLTVNDVVCSEVDVMASNGVIHVFDKVLIPDSVKTIGQILDQMGLWTFLEYARDAGMEDILDARQGTEQLTIFAPNDLAFKSMSVPRKKYAIPKVEVTVRVKVKVKGSIKDKDKGSIKGKIKVKTALEEKLRLREN